MKKTCAYLQKLKRIKNRLTCQADFAWEIQYICPVLAMMCLCWPPLWACHRCFLYEHISPNQPNHKMTTCKVNTYFLTAAKTGIISWRAKVSWFTNTSLCRPSHTAENTKAWFSIVCIRATSITNYCPFLKEIQLVCFTIKTLWCNGCPSPIYVM